MTCNDFWSKDFLSFQIIISALLHASCTYSMLQMRGKISRETKFSSLKIIINMVFLVFLHTCLNSVTFHDFLRQLAISHDFQGLENKNKKSLTFPVFHDMWEPWRAIIHKIWSYCIMSKAVTMGAPKFNTVTFFRTFSPQKYEKYPSWLHGDHFFLLFRKYETYMWPIFPPLEIWQLSDDYEVCKSIREHDSQQIYIHFLHQQHHKFSPHFTIYM